MILSFAGTLSWVGLLIFLEWRALPKASPSTRWVAIGLLVLSSVVWQLLMSSVHMSRPGEWLDALFSPFVPVP